MDIEERSSEFAHLSAAERLTSIDELTATLADLTYELASEGQRQHVRSLLDINLVLIVLREELIKDRPSNADIFQRVETIIRLIRMRKRPDRKPWLKH